MYVGALEAALLENPAGSASAAAATTCRTLQHNSSVLLQCFTERSLSGTWLSAS